MSHADPRNHIVAIGASAGGLEAIREFFNHTPADTGLIFVVIQHLSPDFKSMMNELLHRNTQMKIFSAEHGMEVQPNCVYLIPPKMNMTIVDGRLELVEQDRKQVPNLPINLFFSSMAISYRDHCVAVVLSGTGSDGSKGILDVREHGGLVLTQDLGSAKFDGMPRSAIDTKTINKILPPGEMPAFILNYLKDPEDLNLDEIVISGAYDFQGPFAEVFQLLHEQHGINMEDYKPNTITRRVVRRIKTLGINSIEEYTSLLKEHPDELNLLMNDLIIGVTTFFRDENAFDFVTEEVIPKVFERAQGTARVWVCGCSTGEEAYSLAMLCDDYLQKTQIKKDFKIFATDLLARNIQFASHGEYEMNRFTDYRRDLVDKHFQEEEGKLKVNARLRGKIVFTTQNIITDPPFTRLDMITCRNLLIYLRPDVQKRVISSFHFGLNKDGNLFLGPSEALGTLEEEFEPINAKWKIFSKRRDIKLGLRFSSVELGEHSVHSPSAKVASHPIPRSFSGFEYDSLLKELIPNGLIISQQLEITHVFGMAKDFLSYPEGRIGGNNSLLQLVDKSLGVLLNTAVLRARKTHERVSYQRVQVSLGGKEEIVHIVIKPLGTEKKRSDHILILIEKAEDQTLLDQKQSRAGSEVVNIDLQTREMVTSLEEELQFTKESLQATIEELETTNEELQSSNEELIASNEELQSTNEELQSVNEELYTVNSEHQQKIVELTELNHDMDNLFASTQIGTVFVDKEFRIRKFNRHIEKSIGLLPHDIGRSIKHFGHYLLDNYTLLENLQSVLDTRQKVEREVQDESGHWFLLRITPYEYEGKVNGLVLSMIEIDSVKKAEERFKLAVEASPSAMLMVNEKQEISLINKQVEEVFGYPRQELQGKQLGILIPEEVREAHIDHFMGFLKSPEARPMGQNRELQGLAKDGRVFPIEVGLTPVTMGDKTYVISSVVDITDRLAAEEALKQQQIKSIQAARMASIGEMAAGIAHEINNPLTVIKGKVRGIHHVLRSGEVKTKKLEDSVTKIDETVDRISTIIKGLRTFSRDGDCEPSDVINVGQLIDDTLDFCKARIESDGIQLRVHEIERDLKIRCRVVQLSQVLLNLIQNSRDAVKSMENPWIEVKSYRHDCDICLRVNDSGSGIPREVQEKIFDPFYTSKELGHGTGLGLSLSRNIVEGHGGTLVIDPQSSNTSFLMTLPIIAEVVS